MSRSSLLESLPLENRLEGWLGVDDTARVLPAVNASLDVAEVKDCVQRACSLETPTWSPSACARPPYCTGESHPHRNSGPGRWESSTGRPVSIREPTIAKSKCFRLFICCGTRGSLLAQASFECFGPWRKPHHGTATFERVCDDNGSTHDR